MSYKLTKKFTFDCAHMLTGHDGKCANLHGHTYTVEVTVERTFLIEDGSSSDMVIDLADLTRIVNEEIIDDFDHAMIVNRQAMDTKCCEADLGRLLLKYGLKVTTMPCRTTAENMARYFYNKLFERIRNEFGLGIIVSSVKVWETPKGCAQYGN